ncbi:hypothetical protein GALL_42610 [mine drainage metagenome]|uniref:DUF2846 domain-containing protein n=1 Tax=mine drainage metagenome TaxID=410659 RepID=A0A1J5TSY7_9ZZZZ
MKKNLIVLVFLIALSLLQGCASGPSYSAMANSIPPVPADKGRIYFYRPSVLGAAIQPAVRVDGVAVGKAQSEGFFYVDLAPGSHVVETTTEVSRRLTFLLGKGQTRYVKLAISIGFAVGHVYPELVDDAVGQKGVQDCKYIGTAPSMGAP